MNVLTFLMIQARLESIVEVLILLLLSAMIGYLTAWLYSRNIFRKAMLKKETEKEKLRQEIDAMNEEIDIIQNSLSIRNIELKKLEYDNQSLRIGSKPIQVIQKKDNLRMISGIGSFIEERLNAIDINTFEQISNFTRRDIQKMNTAIEYFSGRIERDEWVTQAKTLIDEQSQKLTLGRIRGRKTRIYFDRIGIASMYEANDLTAISGIGGWIEMKLNALEIFTFQQIANLNNDDVELLTEAIEYFPGRIERDEWVHQANDLLRINGNKAALHDKIREQKAEVSYQSFGVADIQQANNLTLIKGISPWIEERLNLLEIYTFKQISKLSADDIESISEILDLAPSRIQQDKWVAQAKELIKTKVPYPMHLIK